MSKTRTHKNNARLHALLHRHRGDGEAIFHETLKMRPKQRKALCQLLAKLERKLDAADGGRHQDLLRKVRAVRHSA